MRTSLYLGLLYIGDAIGQPAYVVGSPTIVMFMRIVLLVFIVMDFVDFLRKRQAAKR